VIVDGSVFIRAMESRISAVGYMVAVVVDVRTGKAIVNEVDVVTMDTSAKNEVAWLNIS
jgi:hypothetical protein